MTAEAVLALLQEARRVEARRMLVEVLEGAGAPGARRPSARLGRFS